MNKSTPTLIPTPTYDEASQNPHFHADLPLSREYGYLEPAMQMQICRYVEGLGAIERKAYLIAHKHLGTSFHIARSNGFIAWAKEHPHPL